MTRALPGGMHLFVGFSLACAVALGACGGGGTGGSFGGDAGGSQPDTSTPPHKVGNDAGRLGGGATVTGLSISPASATITSTGAMAVTQPFHASLLMSDGTKTPVTTGASWTSDTPAVGAIAPSGLFMANGSLGGVVHVTASYQGQTASAVLTVKLMIVDNPGNIPQGVQTSLETATAMDASVVWAYPYSGTVWPRGLLPPTLMWNGGAATDDYLVYVHSSTVDLQIFGTATNAPSSQFAFDTPGQPNWERLTDSSSGTTTLTVARWNGSAATVIANQTWTIAPASMRGTIYYWSNNLGRVLRIQPGAAAPDDFANQAPLTDTTTYPASSCLMTCHTVSANGSTIVSGGGAFGGSYDLLTEQPMFSLGGTWGPTTGAASSSSVIEWSNATLSPDGSYLLTNAMAEGLAYANDGMTQGFLGLYNASTGALVPNSGLAGVPVTQPAWSPEGSRIVFVNAGDPLSTTAPWYSSWNVPPPGDLEVYQFDASQSPMVTGPTTLVTNGTDATKTIAWPSVTPDGQWVIYERGVGADTRSGNADLYFASAVTPNEEVRLAAVDGDGYPFAAGARDLSWNYEPSFAPVAAGGYFWVVFTSRRTYGNILTGQAEPCANVSATCAADPNCATDSCASMCACTTATEVKQIWLAAIDQNPTPGVDPSHAAFHLTGQDEANLAMRGFYSLPPCKASGQSCGSGTDCCGGYCNPPTGDAGPSGAPVTDAAATSDAGDAGAFALLGGTGVCGASAATCSEDGDKCAATSNCCGASTGSTCINHVCSEPTPP
jgi:WD40-like Beta Propeller Repeat